MITIDKGMPIPEKRPVHLKYPWLDMEIGDSFLFPDSIKKTNVYSACSRASKVYKREFKIRKTEKGYRCWRTK